MSEASTLKKCALLALGTAARALSRGCDERTRRGFEITSVTDPASLMCAASQRSAPVVLVPVIDEAGAGTARLVAELRTRAPSARIAVFVPRVRHMWGRLLLEAIRSGAEEVLLEGRRWERPLLRLRSSVRRPVPEALRSRSMVVWLRRL